MLDVSKLSRSYGTFLAVDQVCFSIKPGDSNDWLDKALLAAGTPSAGKNRAEIVSNDGASVESAQEENLDGNV